MNLAKGGGDVDFFFIHLNAGEIITIITTPMEDPFNNPDTMLGFFDDGGTMLDFNDDANGLGSAIRYLIEETGNYFIGVTGWPDDEFIGEHGEDGDYALTVSIVVIPAPATGALLALAGFATRRRRRK